MVWGEVAALLIVLAALGGVAAQRHHATRQAQKDQQELGEKLHRSRNALQLIGALARLQAGATDDLAIQQALQRLDQRQTAVGQALNHSLRQGDGGLADIGVEPLDAGAAALRIKPYPLMRLAVMAAALGRPTARMQGEMLLLSGRADAPDSAQLVGVLAESFGGGTDLDPDGTLLVFFPPGALAAAA